MKTLPLLFLVACSDFGLTPVKDERAAFDTATADTAPSDEGADTGSDTSDTSATETSPPDTVTPAGCGTFSFTWTAPVVGVVELDGEFTQPDGPVVVAWTELTSAAGNTATATRDVCPPMVFRGQGLVRTDEGEVATWSCMWQSAEEEFAIVGTVEMSFEGLPLDVEIIPAPTSDGCELTAAM